MITGASRPMWVAFFVFAGTTVLGHCTSIGGHTRSVRTLRGVVIGLPTLTESASRLLRISRGHRLCVGNRVLVDRLRELEDLI
jgi:hypothetical protein